MKNKFKFILLFIVAIFLVSCSTNNSSSLKNQTEATKIVNKYLLTTNSKNINDFKATLIESQWPDDIKDFLKTNSDMEVYNIQEIPLENTKLKEAYPEYKDLIGVIAHYNYTPCSSCENEEKTADGHRMIFLLSKVNGNLVIVAKIPLEKTELFEEYKDFK